MPSSVKEDVKDKPRGLIQWNEVVEKYSIFFKAGGGVLVSIFLMSPVRFLSALAHMLWSSIGVAIGVGVGFGLAMHVYEQLQDLYKSNESRKKEVSKGGIQVDQIRPKSSLSRSQSNMLEDGSSYFSLMALAGYQVDGRVLRGQVLRSEAEFWNRNYPFTNTTVSNQFAPNLLQKDWPGLPVPVSTELGRFVEHIVRDFIAGWYCKLDAGCVFLDEKERRKMGIGRDGQSKTSDGGENKQRKMVFSTVGHRRIPMLEQIYSVLSTAFGSLATRAEHVNILSLALLKWTQVLAHTVKVYRQLRKTAEEKNETDKPSEVQITREFLLAGRLHKAVTFGLDVPSLLFADAEGTECGTGTERPAENSTQVLEERLFETTLLKECELDYNRVVAFRLVRALLPRSESSSGVVMAMVVEIMAACVLQPLMNLWTPVFLNELIVTSLAANTAEDEKLDENDDAKEENTCQDDSDPSKSEVTLAALSETNEKNHVVLKPGYDEVVENTSLSKPWSTFSDSGEEDDDGENEASFADALLTIASAAIEEMERHVRSNQAEGPEYQKAVIRIVMVIEAAILEGRCGISVTEGKSNGSDCLIVQEENLPHVLMDLTSNMAAFENKISLVRQGYERGARSREENSSFEVDANEVSMIRTLITTWVQTGQLYTAVALVTKAADNFLRPFYYKDAFLASKSTSTAFLRSLKALDGAKMTIETIGVLSSPRLDLKSELQRVQSRKGGKKPQRGQKNSQRLQNISRTNDSDDTNLMLHSDMMTHNLGNSSTPRYLDFHKNSAFAASLRSERERRTRSWESQTGDETLLVLIRRGAPKVDIDLHEELHRLSRTFYNGTNVLTIRDAAKRSEPGDGKDVIEHSGSINKGKVSLITVETVSVRRRIEIPDDDSSFLLRAQPRPLNPVSVHRDDRNHDLSYRCYLCTYEDPAMGSGSNLSTRAPGGKYIRRCFLQYYPIDRTATIMLHNDHRKIDRRKGRSLILESSGQQNQSSSFLSGVFLRERHQCQKSLTNAATTQSFLSSSVMEATDFNATPRNGKALDFVYRLSLFERPEIDLAGKHFTVHDSTARGNHRSDASALEMSDASLSFVLLTIGREFGAHQKSQVELQNPVEMGPDGYPMLFMKFKRKTSEESGTEIKPYRLSFVRAALMITSTRQEAQFQSLVEAVKAGSARSATKARTEALLKPTQKILEFANDRSSDRVRASKLLRDLKLGVYHIDREQLRRNGLLNPRSPTAIVELAAKVDGAVQAKEVAELFSNSRLPPSSILYRITCEAKVILVGDSADAELNCYVCDDGTLSSRYIENWTIYRSMKDFQVFHRHIKSQVSSGESSASTGSRLVGAAAAAFTTSFQGRSHRKALVPSLAQASKTGAIAVTQKSIAKRGELLNEYLAYLLEPGHALGRSTELMLFLGASFPFPPEVHITETPIRMVDPLGRTNFMRTCDSKFDFLQEKKMEQMAPSLAPSETGPLEERTRIDSAEESLLESGEEQEILVTVLNKVDQVPLAEVRNRFVELFKYQFGFENASFFRSRMLSALETASFVAMTKASEFRKLLYSVHTEFLNGEAIGSLIEKLMEILWPDGCWMVPREVLSLEEEIELRQKSREHLDASFPEQLRTILGNELTSDGLDIMHEMLQNRVVVKSLFYMLFDLLWIEIFPEIRDGMDCASALDIQ